MVIDSEAASAGKRLAAFGWDYLIIAGYVAILAVVSLEARPLHPARLTSPKSFDALAFVTLVLPVAFYFAVSEGSGSGGTWGKRRMGLRVVGPTGGPVTITRAAIRAALKFLPWQIAHTCLFHIPGWPIAPEAPPLWVRGGFAVVFVLVGTYLWGLFSPMHRTLYDQIARTRVVIAGSAASA